MAETKLHCDMARDCEAPVTHLDDQGYVYCAPHGRDRRGGGIRCRQLTPAELKRLRAGEALGRY